ncbi:MAG: helix-turn-helix transcriptional regulator [Actinomycetota bacterium]
MVKNGHDAVPIGFRSTVHPLLPVEIAERGDPGGRAAALRFGVVERPSFDYLLLMRGTGGHHTIDFVDIPARPGRLVRLRAGQAHRWDRNADFAGTIVLGKAEMAASLPWFPGDPSFTDLEPASMRTADDLIRAMGAHQRTFDGGGPSIRLLATLFDALAALYDHSADNDGSSPYTAVYVAFRRAVEAEPVPVRNVGHFARLLGYSERTLTRSCLEATGHSAKQVLTDRLILQAKRLLAQSDQPVGRLATALGFTEPTNFTKFFARHAGVTPRQFRDQGRGGDRRARST